MTEADIERIVSEVIRRLLSMGAQVRSAETETSLRIEDRVITLATIEGRLSGVKTLEVATKSVVTPSVKDELRKQNIELKRG